jgi:hypothetical protein
MRENYDWKKSSLDLVETFVELSSHVQLKLIENPDVYPKKDIFN